MTSTTRTIAPRLIWLILALGLLAGAGLGALVGPERQRLSGVSSGDPELAGRVRALLGERAGLRSVVVAEVTRTSVRWAGLGDATNGRSPGTPPTDRSSYELGSITKTFTGALFAEAIERGEVRADDTLGSRLPELRGTAAGGVTLAALAQHSSGLAPLGATAQAATLEVLLNGNPYATSTTQRLLADAATAPVNAAQPPTYSNFGMALLGTALVRAAGAEDYPSLVAQRITGPLGMTRTTVAAGEGDVPPSAVPGFAANGLAQPRWTGTGYLPAGSSTFTTVGDLATWARAQLTGQAPGKAALKPTANLDDDARIGWAWLTTTGPDGAVTTWHNGGTAGFSTMLALDREAGRAVVLMGNSATDLDDHALALLHGTTPDVSPPSMQALLRAWAPVGLAALFGLLAFRTAARSESLLPIVNGLLVAVFGASVAWTSGPWMWVGGWLWGLAIGPALAALAILGLRARGLPWLPRRRAWLVWVNLVVGIALVALAAALW